MSLSVLVYAWISPYPTVRTVETAQYTEARYYLERDSSCKLDLTTQVSGPKSLSLELKNQKHEAMWIHKITAITNNSSFNIPVLS